MIALDKLMERVFEKEAQGNYEEGIRILEEAVEDNQDLYVDIIYELSMLYFRNGNYYSAVVGMIEVYRLCESDEVLSFIFETYVTPNMKAYQKNYSKNKNLLEVYPFLYSEPLPSFEDMKLTVVWEDEQRMIYFVDGEFVEIIYRQYTLSQEVADKAILFVDAFDKKNLLNLETENRRYLKYISEVLYELNPIYLFYHDMHAFLGFLCINSIQEVLEKERFVFLIEKKNGEAFFENLQTVCPNVIFDYDNGIDVEAEDLLKKREDRVSFINRTVKTQLEEYYEQHKQEIIGRIQMGKPKLMFLTCLYTTAGQHHTQNFYKAAIKKGLEASLLIEKTNIQRNSLAYIWDEINKEKPDIIIEINQLRFNSIGSALPSLVYVTWVQDPMPDIMDKNTPEKLLKNDFLLNHWISWKDFFDVGYDKAKLIEAPVPSNQDVYKSYNLSMMEKERYGCDICMVCHTREIYNIIENECNRYDTEFMKNIIRNMYLAYYRQVLETEEICHSIQDFKDFVQRYFMKENNLSVLKNECESIAFNMYMKYGETVYRYVMVEWILNAGYKNIKLWGNGWNQTEKFIPFAMGAAENGEKLSKIYQASKINLGNNCSCTAPARVWETMLSEGFYLSNDIPIEADAVNIRMILQPEDYVMFHSKSDLLEKIEYYLNHETERLEMVERGRKKALEKMTFDVLLDCTLNALKEKVLD